MSAEAATLTKRAEAYRDYSPELKAAVIQAIENNGGNVNGTAQLFDVPRDTVLYWWRNRQRFTEVQQEKALALSDKLESIAHDQADSIACHDLSVVSLKDKATVLAITIDKMQLLRGQPTSITENIERQELTLTLQQSLAGVIDVEGE